MQKRLRAFILPGLAAVLASAGQLALAQAELRPALRGSSPDEITGTLEPGAAQLRRRAPRRVDGLALRGRNGQAQRPLGNLSTRYQQPIDVRPNNAVLRALPRPPPRRTEDAPRVAARPDVVAPGLPEAPLQQRRRVQDIDPYAPLGLRLGSVTLFPSIEAGIGYDTNPDRAAARGKGSLYHREGGEIRLRSNWSAHELTGELRGAYLSFPSLRDANRPEGSARVNLRFDAARETQLEFEGRGRIDSQRPGSPDVSAAVIGRPLTFDYGASAGVTQRFNRFSINLRASADRFTYQDGKLTNGAAVDLASRNYDQYGLRLRAGYEINPGLVPFIEAAADTRRRDQAADPAGFRRSSDGLQVRAGTSFEVTRTVTGEISAGYGGRRAEDTRLGELRGPIAEVSLGWQVTPLTSVGLRGTTTFDETTISGSTGAISRRLALDVRHALLRNLTLTGNASFTRADYQGISRTDDGVIAGVGAEYAFTRNLVLRASYSYDRAISTQTGSGYRAHIMLFGLRAQL